MTPSRTLTAVLIASLAAAAAPAAAAPKKPKSAKYDLTIEGRQLTSWDYTKRQSPSCDWPEQAGGTQKIEFDTPKGEPAKVKVVAEGGGVAIEPGKIDLLSYADMSASWRRLYTQQSACPGRGPYGGGGQPPQDDIGSARCGVFGQIELLLGTSRDELYQPGDPLRPPGADPKSSVIMRGAPKWESGDSYMTLPGACDRKGQPNADSYLTVDRGEHNGGLVEFVEKLPAKKLLAANAKKVTVSGKVTVAYPNGLQPEQPRDAVTGKTVLHYELTFKRRKR
jgi:hypothetical protein